MKCPQCGSECPNSALFCTECGTALPAAPVDDSQPMSAPQPAETQPEPEAPAQPAAAPQPAAPVAQPVAAPPQPVDAAHQQASPPTGQPQAPYGQPIYEQASNTPWYGKTWVVVLFLLFFWPIGVVLMWLKSCRWSKVAKIVISAIVGISVICYISLGVTMFSSLASLGQSSGNARLDPAITAPSTPKDDSRNNAPAPSAGTLDSSRLKDAKGNPTVYALINIDGSDLDPLLQSCDLRFDKQWEGWIGEDMSRTVDLYDSSTNDVSLDTIGTLSSTELLQRGDFFVTCGESYDSIDSFASSVVNTDSQKISYRSDGESTIIYEVTDLDGNKYSVLVSESLGSYSYMITQD